MIFIKTPYKPPVPPVTILKPGQFAYKVNGTKKVSNTVWQNNKMVRTLYGANLKTGDQIDWWDGKNDQGNPLTGDFKIKGVKHDIQDQWLGALGNSSDSYTGENVWRGFEEFCGIAIVGLYGYAACGYQENMPSTYKFLLTQPGVKLQDFNYPSGTHQETHILATDGTAIFKAGVDPFSNYVDINNHDKNVSFVWATLASNDSEVLFSSGTSYKCGLGRTYPKALSVVNNPNGVITGLAANSSFIFIARKGLNNLYVLDRTTGALLQTISISNANLLAVDSSGDLWVQVGSVATKYTVAVNGTITNTGITATGLSSPQAMNCKGTELHVVDGGTSHQIKRFNASGGSIGTFGLAGGYATNENVANNKFYFSDPANRTHTSGIAFQSNGNWWVVDGGNYRLQCYNSSDVFQTRIQYMPHIWSNKVIPGTGGKVRAFIDYLEFEWDPLQPLNTATFIKNWGYNVPASKDDEFKRLAFVHTLSGQTIAWQKNGSGYEFVILKDGNGLYFTGTIVSQAHSQLYPNGKVRRQNAQNAVTNAPQIFYERSYTIAGDTITLGAEVEIGRSPNKTISDPLYWGTRDSAYSAGERLSDGSIVSFDPNSDAYGSNFYKLGIIKNNEYVVRANIKTASNYIGEFPEVGWHDGGNSVKNAAGRAVVFDDFIWIPYHGENWKSGQTSKVNIFTKDGVPLYQFGTTTWDTENLGEAPAGLAGNMFYISPLKVGNDYLVFTGDESVHGGIGVWKLTGFNTIENIDTSLKISGPVASVPSDKINLLEGLHHGGVNMANGNGWTLDTDFITNNETTDYYRVRTGLKSYRKDKSPDIWAEFAASVAKIKPIVRSLPSETISQCVFEEVITFDRNYFNTIGSGNNLGQYFEVLDISDKVISRFQGEISLGGSFPVTIKGNGVTIVTGSESAIKRTLEHELPLKITINSSGVTFVYSNYAPVTTAILDPTADWTKPGKVRIYFFWNSGLKLQKKFGIKEFFYSRTLATPAPTIGGFKWTSEEMDFWVQRYLDGEPYNNKGDVKTNSPGDWAEIIASANQLLNNPYIDRYDGPTANLGTGGFVKANSTPEPFAKGARILDAAYAGRVIYQAGIKIADLDRIEKGTEYINAAKTAILDQIGRSGVDFSNTTRWQNGKIGDVNPGFMICEWVARLLCAFDFVKSFCSSPQVTSFDTWLLNATTFWNNDLNHSSGVNQWFTNRDNPDRPDVLTLSPAGMGSDQAASYYGKKTHDGGYNIITFNTHWNNRRTSTAELICYAGCYLNNDAFKESAKWWVKDVLKYGVFANGMFADMERGWNGGTPSGSAGHEQGGEYGNGIAENFGDMADALARTGDKELFTYSTSAGLYGTEGGPKTIFKTMQVTKSIYTKIGWTVNGNLLDGENGTWKSDRILGLLIANTYYYKDLSINEAILRNTPGMNPYPATPAKPGPYRSSTGNGGQHAGKYFMYARPSLSLTFSPYPS